MSLEPGGAGLGPAGGAVGLGWMSPTQHLRPFVMCGAEPCPIRGTEGLTRDYVWGQARPAPGWC